MCEEGDEDYDESFCTEHNVITKPLESENDFTVQNIKRIAEEINPQQIIIEYNGMWDISHSLAHWDFGQLTEIVLLDAQCFEIYSRLDEALPYNINHDLIVLRDADFGIFYVDVTEYVRCYIGKRVCFRGYVFKKKPNMPLIGRPAMTCCMEDITVFAFICDTAEAADFKEQQWVRAEGLIKKEYFKKVNASVPIIDILWIAECPEPEEKIINTFKKRRSL